MKGQLNIVDVFLTATFRLPSWHIW